MDTNYRKIYERHYGPIPKDSDGRTYEIHHVDGNHSNNKIENLRLASRSHNVLNNNHKNIHFDGRATNPYSIRVRIEKKSYTLGRFKTKEEAIAEAEKRRAILTKEQKERLEKMR